MDTHTADRASQTSGKRLTQILSFLTLQRLLGVLLLAAAGLKATNGADTIWPIAVVVEVLLGLWLLTSFYPTASRWTACVCFMAFLAVSLHKALAGEASCGCFGRLTVNPWLTAGFNTAVIVGLCLTIPGRGAVTRRWLAGVAILTAVSFGMAPHVPFLSAGWPGRQSAATEVIDPRLWIGRPLDVSEDTWDGEGIDEGDWFVAFYSPGCGACRADFDRLCEAVARRGRSEERRVFVAIIEVPASGAEAVPCDFTRADARGRLRPGCRFVAPTPLILEVRGGFVVGYAHSAEIASR